MVEGVHTIDTLYIIYEPEMLERTFKYGVLMGSNYNIRLSRIRKAVVA